MPTPLPVRRPASMIGAQSVSRGSTRMLEAIQELGLVREASVRAEGSVQVSKLHEIDSLIREAMCGQAMLAQWRSVLSQGDPFIADELRFFTDVARLGKGEIIADTVDSFCRESRP